MADLIQLAPGETDLGKIVAALRAVIERYPASEDAAASALQSPVVNADLADMVQATIKGRAAGSGTGTPIDLTAAQVRVAAGIDGYTTVGDANYSVLATDRYVATTAALTAPRTWTMPAANSVNAGYQIILADLANGVTSTNTLIVARSGSDTINGNTSFTINAPGQAVVILTSDGSSKWSLIYAAGGVQGLLKRVSQNQGDVLYFDGSNWSALTPGTSGNFLKTNGAGANPAWAAAPSGGLTVLSYAGAVGTGTTYTVTGLAGYKMFIINMRDVSHNSGSSQTFRCAVSGDNGGSFGTAISPTNGSAYTAAQGVSGIFFVTNVDQTNNQSVIIGSTFVASLTDTSSRGPINALQFSFAGGNFDNGSIDIYGLK